MRLSRYIRGGAASLSSRRHTLRGIPPLVQPLPFATCRRRSVRERILACLRHFSKKRLAVFGPAPIRSGTTTCNIVSLLRLFYESGKTRRIMPPMRHEDEISFDSRRINQLSDRNHDRWYAYLFSKSTMYI